MDLVIDVGNTSVKFGLFQGDELVRTHRDDTLNDNVVKDLVGEERPRGCILSNVGSVKGSEAFQNLMGISDHFFELSPDLPVPVGLDLEDHTTLGMDRLANAVGGWKSSEKEQVLVIDVGTCITYDLVQKNTFKGGAISPGLGLRAMAMHKGTGRLPLVKPEETDLIGRNTKESMNSGVFNGTMNEIKGMVRTFKDRFGDLEVFLTGGDAFIFEKELKKSIFAHPYITLIGLHAILIHNIPGTDPIDGR